MKWFFSVLVLLPFSFAKDFASCIPNYGDQITAAASEYGIPKELLAAEVITESSFRSLIINPETASKDVPVPIEALPLGWDSKSFKASYGLLQVRGITAWSLAAHYPKESLLNINLNLRLGAKLLRQLFNKYGNWSDAVAAYNAGRPPNPTYVNKVFKAWATIVTCEQIP